MNTFIDKKNRFIEQFNPETGFYIRSGVIDESGKDTGIDPFMRCFPSLIDVGIMQRCVCANKCNVDCYQKAKERTGNNMSIEDYRSILEQCKGKVFQCLYENEVVLKRTNDGTVGCIYIKDVNVGDEIFCGNGEFSTVYEKNVKMSDVYELDMGYGKKIIATKEHRFPTKAGLKTVGELEIGDEIIHTCNNTNIRSVWSLDIVKKIIELNLGDSFFLSDCPGLADVCREIGVKRNANKSVKINLIKDYLDVIDYSGASISYERSQYKFRTTYDVTEGLMKLLGHYVGNGSKRSYVISSKRTKMIETIEACLCECFPNFQYKKSFPNENVCNIEVSSGVLHSYLFDKIFQCRCSDGKKQFPNFIYSVSHEMQAAFLSGYFCDGNFRVRTDDGKYGEVVFNTSSEKMHHDICLLLSVMGVDYSVRTEERKQAAFSKSNPRIINRSKRYRICIGNLKEIFKLKGIVDDHENAMNFNEVVFSEHNPKYLRDRTKLCIKKITPLEEKKRVVDVNIDSKDHLFVTSHGIITHNCALGGAGDVDTHEQFEEILKLTREYGIVPNFTTSGIAMTKEKAEICKQYTGAVAVSEHNAPYTEAALDMLIGAGVKTNIHYVLGANSIDEAIRRLKTNSFKEGISAVVFLLYKNVGYGRLENVLQPNDPRVKEFFELIDGGKFHHKIGFDSCCAPGITNFTKNINMDSMDFCEGGRHSMYIDANMNAMPCSFGNQDPAWNVSLRDHTIQEAWDSDIFEKFRSSLRNSCAGCKVRSVCAGGCPISRDIVLCERSEKELK